MRRWQEIRIRQHRLLAEADKTTPAHIEQIMKSGFSMSDIKGTKQQWLFYATLKINRIVFFFSIPYSLEELTVFPTNFKRIATLQ